MGKNTRGVKEYSKTQQLYHENDRLKKQISSLRKQLARLDLDRYDSVKKTLEEHYANEERHENTSDMLESLKNTWKCHVCNAGYLEINIFSKAGDLHYYRHCNECDNRTTSQPYSETVKGIVRETAVEEKPNKSVKSYK